MSVCIDLIADIAFVSMLFYNQTKTKVLQSLGHTEMQHRRLLVDVRKMSTCKIDKYMNRLRVCSYRVLTKCETEPSRIL